MHLCLFSHINFVIPTKEEHCLLKCTARADGCGLLISHGYDEMYITFCISATNIKCSQHTSGLECQHEL